MKVVIVIKVPFNTITLYDVVSITKSGENIVINDGVNNHTYKFNDVKVMIV